jgi:hypothetical protein
MKTHIKAVLGCVLAACLCSTAWAKVVTSKDLVGKKICWTAPTAPSTAQSTETTYYPGGKFYNTYWGKVTCQGFPGAGHCVADNGSASFDEGRVEKLPDGTFKVTVIVNGRSYENTGHYCQ